MRSLISVYLKGNELLSKLRKTRSLADDDEDDVKPSSGPAKSQKAEQPARMRGLLERCKEWLAALPVVHIFLVNANSSLVLIYFLVLQYSAEAVGGQSRPTVPVILP